MECMIWIELDIIYVRFVHGNVVLYVSCLFVFFCLFLSIMYDVYDQINNIIF